MTANTFGERFAGREIAWHRLGIVKPEGWPTAKAAFTEGRLNYQIVKLALAAKIPGKAGHSKLLDVTQRLGLYREPVPDDDQYRYLGVCAPGYEVVQNMELAEMVDRLGLPAMWPVETVGALGNGETVFLCLKDSSHQVAGLESETLDLYFLITDTRDTRTAMRFAFTPVRVVCQNTLVQALGQAVQLNRIFHNGKVKIEAEDRLRLMAGLQKAQTETLAGFEQLAKMQLSPDDVKRVLTAAYPFPAMPSKLSITQAMTADETATMSNYAGSWTPEAMDHAQMVYERELARIQKVQTGALDRYLTFNEQQPILANTGWALYNAVVENEDFRDGPASMYYSTLFGQRAQSKVAAMAELLPR